MSGCGTFLYWLFIAGTIVAGASSCDDLVHPTPIEQITQDQLVWAKNEFTGEIEKCRVVHLFTTHPDHLHHVSIDTDGDGQADETLSGTAEHPFWNRDSNEWVRMGDLKPGTRLLLLNREEGQASTPAYVLANQRQNAPPGEEFTTYNFEVADYHTYFVGESGVWVHNTGRTCHELFAVYFRFLQKNGGDPRAAYSSLITRMPNIAETFLPKAYKQMGKDVKALGGKFDLATPDRRTHILYGDGPGSGGHLFPGQPGKSVFPENWDTDKVMAEISELVSDEALEWSQVTGAAGANLTKKGNAIRWKVEGVRDGVTTRAIIAPRGEGIITAYPID